MNILLTIIGNPQPQLRPRFSRRGNFVKVYDPEKSRSWKETVKWQAIEQKATVLQGALKMNLLFCFTRPKSLPKKIIAHTKKPDLDNCVKCIKDALEGVCYERDSQIMELQAMKIYSDRPRVEIQIFEKYE